jgi:glycosyltransferase involved in cell wall biosynthesis
MHILLIHQAFAALDQPGGTRHHELARFLAEKGNTTTVITSRISYLTGGEQTSRLTKEQFSSGGSIDIRYVPSLSSLHASFFRRLLNFFSFMVFSFLSGGGIKHVDLVWGTSPPIFQGVSAFLLARLKRVPFLFEVRDLWPAFAVAVGVLKNPLLIKMSNWLERFLYRHADAVVVNSPGFIKHVEERGGSPVYLVPNGVDPLMFQEAGAQGELRLSSGLEDRFVVMYAGAHGLSNDLGVVLRAAKLLESEPEIVFVLVGDGKEKPALEEFALKRKIGNVQFHEPVAKSAIPGVFSNADACLAILKPIEMYKTVYPNKVFDYMAAAKPVLLAIDGAIRQVVEDANAGVFVPPGDPQALANAVQELAFSPERAQEMGVNGRQYVVERFDRQRLADELLQIFISLAEKN